MNRRVARVILKSDILLEVVDSRCAIETKNREVEAMIRRKKKQLIRVINKIDLIPRSFLKRVMENMKGFPVSSKTKRGIRKLLREIQRQAGKKHVFVGVVGYPNTGKSSLINALKGRKTVSVGPKPGHTRGEQFIRLKENIMLIDTPGTIEKGYLFGQKPEKIKNPIRPAVYLMEKDIEKVKEFYKVDGENAYEILENIKQKRRWKDIDNSARQILYDWNAGRLKIFWID